MSIRILIVLTVAVSAASLTAWAVFNRMKANDPLPAISDIQHIKAWFYHHGLKRDVEFELPKEYWAPIFAAMRPARRDRDPAKWIVQGNLEVMRNDGRPFRIDLYVADGPGAFSAGTTHEQRVYYRGGASIAVEAVLRQAWESVENSQSRTGN